jgi:hypothetical protein
VPGSRSLAAREVDEGTQMRRQQPEIRAQRPHSVGLLRGRLQHAVRALPVTHERLGHDLDA